MPTITPLPTPPSRQDPINFSTRADAFLGALPTFATEANALAADVNSKQSVASAAAATATVKAEEALSYSNSASASATATVDLYDMFDNRFLGAKMSDPTLDNDGNALQVGAAYFNTSANETKLWNGSAWQVAFGNITGDFTIVREEQVASAGQTVFNLINSYSVGTNSIMIYLNGTRLMSSDYVETNTTTVTLNTPVNLNDKLLFEIGVVSSGTTAVAGLTSFNPTAKISATNVQDAIVQLGESSFSLAQAHAVALSF